MVFTDAALFEKRLQPRQYVRALIAHMMGRAACGPRDEAIARVLHQQLLGTYMEPPLPRLVERGSETHASII